MLPGVTVDAASPALIEKVRTAVTDGTGQYRIENLRPGTYTVTFTPTGFSISKREGLELVGSMTATVNGELKVGSVEDHYGDCREPGGRLAERAARTGVEEAMS
ncbi:MAG: carboxypeptidase-like regulatory domain-containing protein [Acidobacteriota bacterium]